MNPALGHLAALAILLLWVVAELFGRKEPPAQP